MAKKTIRAIHAGDGGCLRRPRANKPKVHLVVGADWSGIYVDGVLKAEGHSLSTKDVLRAVGINFKEVTPNDQWLADEGSLPEQFVDVKVGK